MVDISKYIPSQDLDKILGSYQLPKDIINIYKDSISKATQGFEFDILYSYEDKFKPLVGDSVFYGGGKFTLDYNLKGIIEGKMGKDYLSFYLGAIAHYLINKVGIIGRNGINNYALRDPDNAFLFRLFTLAYWIGVKKGEKLEPGEIIRKLQEYAGQFEGVGGLIEDIKAKIMDDLKKAGLPEDYIDKRIRNLMASDILEIYRDSIVGWFLGVKDDVDGLIKRRDILSKYPLDPNIIAYQLQRAMVDLMTSKPEALYGIIYDSIDYAYKYYYRDLLSKLQPKQQGQQQPQVQPAQQQAGQQGGHP